MRRYCTICVLVATVVLNGILTGQNARADETTKVYISGPAAKKVVLEWRTPNGKWHTLKYENNTWPRKKEWVGVPRGQYTFKVHGRDNNGNKLVGIFHREFTEDTVDITNLPNPQAGTSFYWDKWDRWN
jgi:hypothetical protein